MAGERYLRRRAPMGLPANAIARTNPQAFGRGFSDELSVDELAGAHLRRDVERRGTVALDRVITDMDAANLPPQLVQVSFFKVITEFGASGAQLLIPKNPHRWAYLVSNFLGSSLLMFSFDKPINVGANIGAGIPIGGYYQESNGEVTINDIWVFCNDPAETFPMTVLGYEGGISIAGNRRR